MHVTWPGLLQTHHPGGSSGPAHISTLEFLQYELPTKISEHQKSRTLNARSWAVGAAQINLVVQGLDEIVQKVKAEMAGTSQVASLQSPESRQIQRQEAEDMLSELA